MEECKGSETPKSLNRQRSQMIASKIASCKVIALANTEISTTEIPCLGDNCTQEEETYEQPHEDPHIEKAL